jgi:NADH:ubiquinone oxidoreductase subunit
LGIYRTNDVKVGTLVGEDKYGNKYYEDKKQFFGECSIFGMNDWIGVGL